MNYKLYSFMGWQAPNRIERVKEATEQANKFLVDLQGEVRSFHVSETTYSYIIVLLVEEYTPIR